MNEVLPKLNELLFSSVEDVLVESVEVMRVTLLAVVGGRRVSGALTWGNPALGARNVLCRELWGR
ncbi:hypothetical protein [Streptomyces sp. HUAS ZL42]|uniref:hypothetical protein n=1 Tax=Streptomyces sp. HUAS ZL42 TaxID=3231715 RepID=UPI00345EDD6A